MGYYLVEMMLKFIWKKQHMRKKFLKNDSEGEY